ncbi:cell division control protein [Anaeramoeba flamelloides]|uniref:Cell division control protein n=1 Tax=Anaeramoeba flamelloides TaxID=1746091 RepID=A0ABQ8X0S7_9EUKA|nr:cell division control protein [Anaeramoeba flamelloides]
MDTKFSFFQSSFETSAGLPNVYCREKEMKTIKDFFTNKITKPSKANSSLYICGTPGMGKTLSVGEVIKLLKKEKEKHKNVKIKSVFINCATLTQKKMICQAVKKKIKKNMSFRKDVTLNQWKKRVNKKSLDQNENKKEKAKEEKKNSEKQKKKINKNEDKRRKRKRKAAEKNNSSISSNSSEEEEEGEGEDEEEEQSDNNEETKNESQSIKKKRANVKSNIITKKNSKKNQKTKRSQPQKQKKKGKKKSLSDENEDSSDSNKSKESEESEENTESEESKDTDETDESDQTDESEGSDESSESEESEESEESDQFNSSDYEDNIYLEEKEFETQLYEMKEKSQIEKIEFFLKKLKEKVLIVVILDEIDYLVTKNKLNTLYQLFELANSEITNQFVVIGIANALDLTDRVLPYLTLRGIQPSVLGFKPYTIKQTTKILNQRLTLQSENSQGLSISEEAIEFCARKNAKFTGDIREALDICQDAIKVGYEKGEKIISLQTMIHVLNKYYSSTKSKIIENLPLQQKFLITCIMKLIKLKKNNDKSKTRKGTRRSLKTNNFNNRSNYTQKQLNDKKFFSLFILKQEYLNFCQQNKITSNNRLNFNSICENLIGSGIIKITNQKQVPRNRNQYLSRQFQVNVPLYDIKFALKEMPFYKTYIK